MFFSIIGKLGLDFVKEEILLVPSFADVVTDKELGMKAFSFIVACYDYRSPLRHLPEEQRIKRCVEDIFKQKAKVHALDSEKMKRAIDDYNELQRDSDWEEYYAVEEKCTEISQFIKDTKFDEVSADLLDKAGSTLATYNKIKMSLKEILFSRIETEDTATLIAGKIRTFMEKKMSRDAKKGNS